MIKRILKILSVSLLSIIVLLLVLVLDVSPKVESLAHQQVENAEDVNGLIRQLRSGLRDRYSTQQIDVSLNQANSLIGFAQRALPNLAAELDSQSGEARVNLSYKLPAYLFGSYLNLSFVLQQEDALKIGPVDIGDLTLPGDLVLALAEKAANSYTESQIASTAIAQVSKVEIDSDRILVTLNPIDKLLKELKNLRLGGTSDVDELLKIKTAHYLRLLINLSPPQTDENINSDINLDTSLSFYLYHLMKEAQYISQRQSSEVSASATLENEAAIYALAIFAGHRRFASLVGDLSFAIEDTPIQQRKAVLANRKDLSLHFIFSAAIKLMSEQGISNAVGEFKELMDRGKGGSGYSFVDLAADMAGANFATLAVNPATSRQVQDIISLEPNEMLFFPDIQGLEEGMGKAEFKQKYEHVESESYKSVVNTINDRLKKLPIGSAR